MMVPHGFVIRILSFVIRTSSFVLRHSQVIRTSSFVLRHSQVIRTSQVIQDSSFSSGAPHQGGRSCKIRMAGEIWFDLFGKAPATSS